MGPTIEIMPNLFWDATDISLKPENELEKSVEKNSTILSLLIMTKSRRTLDDINARNIKQIITAY
jgi:hypothetical protein